MTLYKIVFVCMFVHVGLSPVLADAESLDKHYQMLTKPMVLEGTMFFKPDERIIEVRYGGVVKYYCQVTIKVDDLGAFREHFDQLRKFNSRIAMNGSRFIKVLSPASKIKRNGVEIFEPLEYRADEQPRKYLLLYCPAIALEEALPFLIAGSQKLR